MALRPSKTEPKLKLYIGATGGSPSEAAERLGGAEGHGAVYPEDGVKAVGIKRYL